MADPTPSDDLDEFLAAPEQLLTSESELKKARTRKARDAARAAQLASTKLATPPTVEDLLEDMVRVAESEEVNPWWEFRCLSARRYELFGHYAVDWVYRQFGTFTHALEVAGLRDQAGTRLWKARRAEESRREHAARYVERHVHPYVAKREEYAELSQSYAILSISDTHSQFLCPFVWWSFLQAIRDLRPDAVLFNGDILEGAEISRFPQIPGWTRPLQEEFDFAREMVRQVREEAGHQGDLFWTGGNHDVDRLAMYLTQSAKGLVSLRTLRIDEQLGLKDFDVKLLTGGTIASPQGTENDKPGFLLFGQYRVHHGTLLGQNPAAGELRAAGRSGQSGHVHRASVAFGTTESTEGMSWMTTPCGCRHEAARAYLRGTNTGWQRGFGWARLYPGGGVHQYPVVVQPGERLVVEGFEYRRPDGMADPEPEGVWIT